MGTWSRKDAGGPAPGHAQLLSGADLAPGVVFQRDGNGNTSLQSGAQNFDHVNVFIDGVGQKNNILRGGLAGQDTSRGNPSRSRPSPSTAC